MSFAGAAAELQRQAVSAGLFSLFFSTQQRFPIDLGSLSHTRRGDGVAVTPMVRFITLHPAPGPLPPLGMRHFHRFKVMRKKNENGEKEEERRKEMRMQEEPHFRERSD